MVLGLTGVFSTVTGAGSFFATADGFFFARNDDFLAGIGDGVVPGLPLLFLLRESALRVLRMRTARFERRSWFLRRDERRTHALCWRGSRESMLSPSFSLSLEMKQREKDDMGYRSTAMDAPIGWMRGYRPKFGSVDRCLASAHNKRVFSLVHIRVDTYPGDLLRWHTPEHDGEGQEVSGRTGVGNS